MRTTVPREQTSDGQFQVVRVMFYEKARDTLDRKDEGSTGCFCRGLKGYGESCVRWWLRRYSDGRALNYEHVELMFSDGAVTSMTQKGGLHYDRSRLLSNAGYMCLAVYVTAEQEARMQRFALAQEENKPQFNKLGYYWNFLPLLGRFPVRQGDSHFFCSEYVTCILKCGGFLEWANPATTDPNTLFVYLKNSEQGVISFNTKLEKALAAKGELPTLSESAKALLGIRER